MIDMLKDLFLKFIGLLIALVVFYFFVNVCIYVGLVTGTGIWGTSILFFIGCFVFGYLGHWKESD